jgi:amidase
MDYGFMQTTELAALVRTRRLGCRELLEHTLARIDRHNPTVNAVIALDRDGARRVADAADARVAAGGRLGPLHGVPITVKESFDVAGLPSTFGLPAFADNVAKSDALVVQRLKAAGAIVFGKTNVPPQLADWQTENKVYGRTRNPWDLERSAGGSSGGAAAALAAGLSALEMGSDIGGSIRIPAHFCGVYGHKPSYGLVPGTGHAMPGKLASSDLTCYGPLARSARDLALAFDIVAGPDEESAAGWKLELKLPQRSGLTGLRVAVVTGDATFEVDRSISDRLQHVAEVLARAGAMVSDRARPDIASRDVFICYVRLLRGATSSRQSGQEFAANAATAVALRSDDESYFAEMMRGNTITHRDWLGFDERRHHMIAAWQAFFADWDLLLCPVASVPAFIHDTSAPKHLRMVTVNGRERPMANDYFWLGYPSVTYLPATTMPIGLSPEGMPVGMQIIAPRFGDLAALRFATLLEDEIGGFVPPPKYV